MALSLDIRERIVKAYENEEGSIRQLSKRFSVDASAIWKLLKRYRNGEGLKAKSPPGRTPLIDDKNLAIIGKLLREDNDATLEELCKRFESKTKLKVAIVTMHRACNRLKIKYKKNSVFC